MFERREWGMERDSEFGAGGAVEKLRMHFRMSTKTRWILPALISGNEGS